MPKPASSPASLAAAPTEPKFAVDYVSSLGGQQFMARAASILGVIGYGAARPLLLAAGVPYVSAPFIPTGGSPRFEVWTAASACRPLRVGPVFGACSDDLAFATIQLHELAGVALEDEVERAYLRIFDFIEEIGFAPIRFWNYLTAITEVEGGLERYQRFNIGRHKAFAARLRQKLPPVASGVGGFDGGSVIYVLAARSPARPIENPRQISAYQYPEIYGPRSPSFSRASVYSQGGMTAFFISGTASIVGHESRHPGDLQSQIAEITTNLQALIDASELMPGAGNWALKIYLQDPSFYEAAELAVEAMFGADVRRIYLHGEICRGDLLLEIEAVQL